jgi:hypothetical protein
MVIVEELSVQMANTELLLFLEVREPLVKGMLRMDTGLNHTASTP